MMRKIVFVSLLILSTVFIVSALSPDSLIQKESKLSYERLLANVRAGKYKSLMADGDNIVPIDEAERLKAQEDHSLKGYDCQHDTIMEKKFKKFKESAKLRAAPAFEDIKEQSFNPHNVDQMKADLNQVQAARQPIRITFNYTYLDPTVDKYSCRTVGQTIVTGSKPSGGSNSPPACDGTLDYCTYTCQSKDLLSNDLIEIITDSVIPTIQNVFQQMILVDRPNPDRIVFDSFVYNEFGGECDYGVNIPAKYTTLAGAPTATDMIVWVTSRPTPSNSTIAYALACSFPYNSVSNKLGKPIAASINFAPQYYTQFFGASKTSFAFNSYIRVGIHEMTHALGFSSTFYSSFATSAAATVTKHGQTPAGAAYTYKTTGIVSPNVVAFVQEHYACPSIQYAELEDIGGSGTAGSHWEKRTAGEEYMIGFVSPISPITNLTMNLLKDSGWYDIAGDTVEKLVWGKNTGCDWLRNCYADTWNYQGYFCASSGVSSCTATRMGKGVCSIYRYTSSLPAPYQHFTNPSYGSGDGVADYCPFYAVNQASTNAESNIYCVDPAMQTNAISKLSEQYGASSRCFEYTSSQDSSLNSACWQQRCNGTNVDVNVGGTWYSCTSDLQQIYVNDDVTIVCPNGYQECGGIPLPVEIINSATQTVTNILYIVALCLLSLLLV